MIRQTQRRPIIDDFLPEKLLGVLAWIIPGACVMPTRTTFGSVYDQGLSKESMDPNITDVDLSLINRIICLTMSKSKEKAK